NQIPKLLRYAFLLLAVGAGAFLLLNVISNLGIPSEGPFLRGFVATYSDPGPATVSLPEGRGEMKIMNLSEKKFVLLGFSDLKSLLTIRHLFYLLSDNMRWVLVIMALFQMSRIFQNLDRKAVFCEDNVRSIRVIAFCVFIYPFLKLEATLQFNAIVSRLPGHGLNLTHVSVFHESLAVGVLLGLIIYSLAEVFRIGTHLQQEQDLTI
ncbi:MAG: DUF2975 domain-containing protein, partial [Saprospiraceae bacterium]